MPNLEDRPANDLFKLLYIGGSGTGKTGSLVSLVKAGYKLRILDMDNGLDSLVEQVKKQCPDKMSSISYMTFRDKYKANTTRGLEVEGRAIAYTSMLKALNEWEDGTIPETWGDKHVLVVDTLTATGKAAFNWARGLDPTAKDGRQWFFSAQNSIENLLDMLTGEEFRTNVIVVSHIAAGKEDDPKMYAASIGSALGPKIPKFFNTMIAAESRGTGDNVKRTIQTRPTHMLDLKIPAEDKVGRTLPLNTGLAEIVKQLKS